MTGSNPTRKEVANALSAIGFNLSWKSTDVETIFRELQADPLAGSVATAA
jgi:hypothetical protein